MWWVRRSEHVRLWQDYREMQNLYWQVTSEVVDLRIDKENLERKMEQLQVMPRPQEKVR